MSEYFHQSNKTIGYLNKTGKDDKEPQEEQQGFEDVEDNSEREGLGEMFLEALIELYLCPVDHVVKGRNEIVLEDSELFVGMCKSGIICISKGNDFLDEQINQINLIISRCLELRYKAGRLI